MHIQNLRTTVSTFAIGLGLLFTNGWAYADPPLRAARLGYTEGQVSFSPVGEPGWVQSTVNRPLTTGDRLWVDTRSRAELQIGGAAIRLGENTDVTLLNADDSILQVQLTQGTLKLHVRHVDANQILEVDTPNLALTLHKPGDYRLDVNSNGDATEVTVQNGGEAEVYGDATSYSVHTGQGYRFYGMGLTDYENVTARVDDDLDRWARERERRIDASASVRFVSPELVGYEDLDANGIWRVDPNYGNVWLPSRVSTGWAPYHDGHWAWVNPWGWTWVDAAPWGYTVSHYGRWANIRGAWAWVPGPVRERAVYAPALVVFLGGTQPQGGTVGWFPLAPREVYWPSYRVSQGYFNHVNRSNAVIAPATITNIYNTQISNVTTVNNITRINYVNRNVTGAVVAVPMHAFAQSQSVARTAVPLPKDAAVNSQVTHMITVMPDAQSLHGVAALANARPPAHEGLHVVARTTPPTPQSALAAQHPTPDAQVKVVNTSKALIAAAMDTPKAVDQKANAFASQSQDARAAATAQAEKAKAETARDAAVKAQTDRIKLLRDERSKIETSKQEAARQAVAEKQEMSRANAAKATAARAQEDHAKVAMEKEAAIARMVKEEGANQHVAAPAQPANHVPVPAPAQAHLELKHGPEHATKPEDKRDRAEEEKKR
jgi:hypothetical protein